jgi:hypothetical protein
MGRDRIERRRKRLEDLAQEIRESGLADPSEPQARERDAELASGEQLVELAHGPPRRDRASAARGNHLVDARPRRRDETEFGRDEEGIERDQGEHSDEQSDAHPSTAPGRPLTLRPILRRNAGCRSTADTRL